MEAGRARSAFLDSDSFLKSTFEVLHVILGSALKIHEIASEAIKMIQESCDILFQLAQEFKQCCIKVIS